MAIKFDLKSGNTIRLGVVGFSASGKDSVANYLVSKYGFTHVSSSDLIRAYITANNLGEPTREMARKVGKELREKYGGDYLVRLAFKTPTNRLVISGLRAIGEIQGLKKMGGIVIAITAPEEMRYKWLQSRGDIDSGMTFEQFHDFENREAENPDLNAQNVSAVVSMADVIIENKGPREDLFKKVDELFNI